MTHEIVMKRKINILKFAKKIEILNKLKSGYCTKLTSSVFKKYEKTKMQYDAVLWKVFLLKLILSCVMS